MIKLKDILFEGKPPSIFVPRRINDRIERMIKNYIRNGSKESLELHNMNLIELPEILKNVTVGGHFFCHNNKLTSLINAPKSVYGSFYCGHNKLTSLEGAPESVRGTFGCNNNKLTSLEGAPKKVGRDFYCVGNRLISLEGAPKTVMGNFHCNDNPVKFTEEQVRAVCDVKGKVIVIV